MNKVVTRIAPSPTGRFHIGTARTALFNYLFARNQGGSFVIRVEDTDRERSKKEYEDEILAGLSWLGLGADETVRQSERVGRHTELLQKLIAEGKAYVSAEESKNEPGKTVEVVRLKNPGTAVTFHDEVRGDITFDTAELGDFVIARSVTDPLYHFAVVADDMDMGITHVIRGDDHISNTPRQILIQEALGAPRPSYTHLPLILDEKRAKLSKRAGATSVMDYRDEGILAEGLVNYLALLGWNPGTEQEAFSLSELVSVFSLSNIQKGGAMWNKDKLLSVNQHWMRALPDTDFVNHLDARGKDAQMVLNAVPLLKDRAKTFKEAGEMLSGELGCLFTAPTLQKESLIAKEAPDAQGTTAMHLTAVLSRINSLSPTPSPSEVKESIMPYADTAGRAQVLWPLRYALSGQERSPDPFTLIALLGTAESTTRIQAALGILN